MRSLGGEVTAPCVSNEPLDFLTRVLYLSAMRMKSIPFSECKCGHKFSDHKSNGGECIKYDGAACWCRHFEPKLRKLKTDEQKQLVLAAFLPLNPFVRVNACHPSARFPQPFQRPDLTMRLGEMWIADLEVTDHGFSGTLTLKSLPYLIFVPWEALDALWIRDVQPPHEGPMVSWKDLPEITAPTPGRRGHLRLVTMPAVNESKEPADGEQKERA